MATGTIRRLHEDRGYGFIAPDRRPPGLFEDRGAGARTPERGQTDLFFHRSAVEGGRFEQLRPGQRVRFEVGRDPRDPARTRAEHVRPLAE